MAQRTAKYRARRVNSYVPAMAYSSDMIHEGPFEVDFGTPAVASTTNILNAQTINGGVTFSYGTGVTATALLIDNVDPIITASQSDFPYGPGFGRCLQMVASGASVVAVTVYGRDYLGQPVAETFTLNGATPVIGVKAFKWLDRVVAASSNVNLSIGTTDKLGLPFCMNNVLSEEFAGVRVSTLGTLVTPSRVDPQTATTTDPRGTYDPQSTLDGVTRLKAVFIPDPSINASGNGGLHGLQHYGG